ncbi:putative tRNA-splicing endonuclease subunit tsp-2 [Tolypocladium ophioglossoides CBS 100239]|uniref:tRNA-intron lyase n=1 Tax=Tolypocladium ophioglossoides (strain CBS 100239) TaxID=1163406 RepID=A0A0L0NI14_TOLOC|nr:putative tRNA-splicing endonuclease subunit tsp-2 [Tolypocladium ophioglossoides CBS 100239]
MGFLDLSVPGAVPSAPCPEPMAEIKTSTPTPGLGTAAPTPKSSNGLPPQKRGPSIHQIYALPAPIRTFPLPTFYPNNPVSLFHVLSAWLSQTLSPPPAEPAVIHQGVWSEATTSVHVMDEKSMRALWEQGFYGKGSLSRSEPNWLKREQVRRGVQEAHVSEILTVQRRQERAQAKWERARLEQDAIQSTRLKEARQAEARRQGKKSSLLPPRVVPLAPVGPLEILSLPNSDAELSAIQSSGTFPGALTVTNGPTNGVPSASDIALVQQEASVDLFYSGLTNGDDPLPGKTEACDHITNGVLDEAKANGDGLNGITSKPLESSDASSDSTEGKSLKRRKSVRFSPKVESTTFKLSDPPSPNRSWTVGKASQQSLANGGCKSNSHDVPSTSLDAGSLAAESEPIANKEHLQLTPEEAFFLSFGLGALSVSDPVSGKTLSTRDMFTMFRQHSYFPPRTGPDEPDLEPDDGFLLHYAVYHHFRSLGWVPRAGIKFGVDWMLYTRGPVFDHAEFGLIVIPSYSDAWWTASGKQAPQKTWSWLHSIVRVLSHVTKSVVLVYVDVPPPPRFEVALETGFTDVLKLYKVREVMVKRWSSNRNR